MPGFGIGLSLGLGGGEGGLSEADIARALAAKGLTDQAARAAIGQAASLDAGLRAVGLMPPRRTPAGPAPTGAALPAGLAYRLMAWDLPVQADNSTVRNAADSAGGVFAAAAGAPRYRTGGPGGKPFIEAADGDRLVLPTASGAGAQLKALIEGGTFTAIVFVSGVIDTGRSIGAVLGSYRDPAPSFILKANGRRAGFYYRIAGDGPFDFPWTGPDLLSIAQVSAAAYPFRTGTDQVNRLYLNAGCIHSSTGQAIGLGDGLGLFGIQNGYGEGNFAGRYHGHLVFDRALAPAEVKQVHRWFCEQTGQATPWQGAAATCSVFGNSLDNGYLTTALEYAPMALAAGAQGLPLGAWDNLGVSGQTARGMAANVGREVHPIAAATGRPHKVLLGEYYNSVYNDGRTGAQTADSLAAMLAGIRTASPATRVGIETPSNTQADRDAGYAAYDAFVSAVLAVPADAYARIDRDPAIGRGGDLANVAYFAGDRLHLAGAPGPGGNAARAAIMAAAFAAMG